jgi:hypothetical protein
MHSRYQFTVNLIYSGRCPKITAVSTRKHVKSKLYLYCSPKIESYGV